MAGLQVSLALQGNLHTLEERVHLALARGARTAAERMLARGKTRLRGDVRQAGLGDRLANVWRADIYPRSKNARTHAPAVVFRVSDRAKTTREDSLGNTSRIASAAEIIQAHTVGPTITSRSGLYMALPTENTPRKGRRFATPTEVEVMFDQDLTILPGRGQQLLAFVDGIRGKSGRGFRAPTKTRRGKGRRSEMVLMFVLVRQVRLRQRLTWPRIFKELEADWQPIFAGEIAAELGKMPS
jgi:uncharacterized protein DUF6441